MKLKSKHHNGSRVVGELAIDMGWEAGVVYHHHHHKTIGI